MNLFVTTGIVTILTVVGVLCFVCKKYKDGLKAYKLDLDAGPEDSGWHLPDKTTLQVEFVPAIAIVTLMAYGNFIYVW